MAFPKSNHGISYDLPKPPKRVGDRWLPVVRIARTVPFGYKVDPDNDKILLPVIRELEILEKAKAYLREYTSRNVAAWVSEQSGRYISHIGLLKRVKQDQRRRRASSTYRRYERLYKKAAEEARKLEDRIGGDQVYAPAKRSQHEIAAEQREADLEIGRRARSGEG